jgi:transmembrane sensor
MHKDALQGMKDAMAEDANPNRPDPATAAAARDWIAHLASGEMTAPEMAAFEDWLDADPSHRTTFEAERSFWLVLGQFEDAFAAPTARAEWSEPQAPGFLRRLMAGAWLAGPRLAAACMVLVAIGTIAGSWVAWQGPGADYDTAVGEMAVVDLPDGSDAYLNTDSAIRVAFSEGERRLELLRGEVFVDVAHDADRPFRVAALDGMTEATGTQFAVRRDSGNARVSVAEGAVIVYSPGTATGHLTAESNQVRLVHGEATRYSPGAAPDPASPVNADAVALWRDGTIRIDNQSLSEALAELDRYHPGTVMLLRDSNEYGAVSGVFNADRIDAAIKSVAMTQGLHMTTIAGRIILIH